MRKGIFLTVLLAGMMVFLLLPASASAVSETGRANYKVMNGVTESTVYVTDNHGQNSRVHILRIAHNAKVSLKVSTAKYYAKGSTKSSRKKNISKWANKDWGYDTVINQAKNYEKSKDAIGKVVAASDGDYYVKDRHNGEVTGKMKMEGNVIKDHSDHNISTGKSEPFFAVLKDGSYAMRDANDSMSDAVEVISGGQWILKDGSPTNADVAAYTETLQLLGLTANNDVVLATADGREPTSTGINLYNAAVLMQKQGCVDVILLDCGGSASFLTSRSGGALKQRNTINDGDGYPRPVSSALLVVSDSSKSGNPKTVYPTKMKAAGTEISKDANGYWRYLVSGKKQTGFRTVNGKPYLFSTKGKGMTKTIKIGKTKYTYKKGAYSKSSDKKAGSVIIGFCGASNGGQNLLFAYQCGNAKLNIGKNPFIKNNSGKMENWTNIADVPWQTKKHKVKTVYVGSGVKNIGGCFLRISQNPFNQDMKKARPKLTSVSLPSSLKTIDNSAFFNQNRLKKLTIPAKVTKIDRYALAYLNGTTITFKGKTPPTFGKYSLVKEKKAKKTTLKVPKTKAWKKFAASKSKKKKAGFVGIIKYVK